MKTIIYYASKHGATKEIAGRLAGLLENATIVNLCDPSIPSPEEAERVIVGGSVYIGKLRKEMKGFLIQHQTALVQRPLGLFLLGLDEKLSCDALQKEAPPELITAARRVDWLGGVINPANCSLLERIVLRLVTGKSGKVDTVEQARLEAFADRMRM